MARIDLTEWKTQPDSRRYITFSKGRIGRKLGDFFMDLLGAREGMDAKVQNKGLLQAVEDYCDSRQLEPTERNDYKKQVFKYCTEQASAGEEIEIKELSAELPGDGALDFYSFIGQEYELEERFPADRSTLRGLTKFVGSGGGLTLSFEQKLLNSRNLLRSPDRHPDHQGCAAQSQGSAAAPVVVMLPSVINSSFLAKETPPRRVSFLSRPGRPRNWRGTLLTNQTK